MNFTHSQYNADKLSYIQTPLHASLALTICITKMPTLSGEAGEYTDCTSAEG